jgi:hypothetical protein
MISIDVRRHMHPHWLFVNWPTGVRFQVVRGTDLLLSIVGFMVPYMSFERHAGELWRIDEASKSSSETDERLRRILLDNVSMPLALDEDRRADGDTIRVQVARYGGDPVLLLQSSHGDLAHDVSALMRILALERSAALSVAKNMPSEVPICAGIKARVEGVSDALAVYGLGSIVARDPEC